MDAFELLKADHKKVAQLFDQLETATGKRKLDVFKQIKSELELHTHVEETIFYPILEKPEETHDLTLEAYEEHKVVKDLLAELAGAKSANDEWQAKAKVLWENVEHHVDEEENELFDKADDALSDEEIEALGARMEAEKARKQGRPAPRQSGAKDATRSKKGPGKPGILAKVAAFVGLGGATSKKGAKKAPAKKKTPPRKGSSASAKTPAKNKGAKSSATTASKHSSSVQGSKRASGSRSSSSSKKRSAPSSGKKASRKRVSRK